MRRGLSSIVMHKLHTEIFKADLNIFFKVTILTFTKTLIIMKTPVERYPGSLEKALKPCAPIN